MSIGVYEMDAAGTVVYHKSMTDSRTNESEPNLIGRNFFDEIAAFQNFMDFRRRFKCFVGDSHPADEFNFDFYLREQILEIKVKLVRARERQDNKNSNLIIVDIRKV
ncbi:MAG: hypothetical protein ACR2N3_11065 [Pyrinomonadaceae bacterium]